MPPGQATPPGPAAPTGAGAPAHPAATSHPGAPLYPAAPAPGRPGLTPLGSTRPPAPGATGRGPAPATRPANPAVPQLVTPRASISPIPPLSGPLPLGRPVPGSFPEPPGPALLAAALREALPASAPAAAGPPPAARDGMNPADHAALLEMQRLVSNSLSRAGGPGDVGVRLRTALAQAQPQLLAAIPGNATTQSEQLADALTWLVHNLDQPPVVAAGCARLGAALAECGVQPGQMQLVGAALAEAMRAGLGAAWRMDLDQAWRTTWQHAYEWIVHGEAQITYQPTIWGAEVVAHERRRQDLAVVRFRPYLPMPFRPGQYARVEVPELPGVWRPYSLAGAPRRDNLIELHVRAKTTDGVSGTLVYRTQVGERVRFARAEGEMGLHQHPGRDLLMIAGDTGVAPLKALLTELADTADPRSAVLFWGVRNLGELYDIEEIAEIARAARRATVVPVISEGEAGPYASGLVTDAVAAYGEWSGHEVYLAGPPTMLAATSAELQLLGVDPGRIHHDVAEG